MTASKNKLTAVIYARYSPRNENNDRARKASTTDKERNSCDVQIDDLRRHAAAQGYDVDERLIFRDDAKSGKSDKKRDGLAAALAACGVSLDATVKLPRVKHRVFLCRDTKRLARNMLDAFFLVRQLVRRGVYFETLRAGRYDAGDPMRFAFFGMEAIMAEVERLNTARITKEKVRRYQNIDLRRMSAIPPFGMQPNPRDDSCWIANPDEQETIEKIVSLRQEGYGLREIGRELKQWSEHATFRGKPWRHQTIAKIIERATPAFSA